MRVCPNINSPEWKSLVGALNEDIAWDTFIRSKGVILQPNQAALLTMVQQSPKEASTLLHKHLSEARKSRITGATSVMELINYSDEEIYEDDIFKAWAIRNKLDKGLGITVTSRTVSKDDIESVFENNLDIARTAYEAAATKALKPIPKYRTKDYPLYLKLNSFLKQLNFSVKTVDDLQAFTGYNAAATTDLLYKTILIANSSSPTELLLRETAYVAYSFLGKKNKIRTDLMNSIENIDNYNQIFAEYKKRSPNLNDYTLKKLIVIDFIADAIKNEYEAPSDSYINRKADYWGIKGNNKLIKKLKYYLNRIKFFVKKILRLGKLNKEEVNALLKDIAHDVLTSNFQKFGTELSPDEQLTNYEKTIAQDPKAKNIIDTFQKIGLILTGSLSLRRLGTLYRGGKENLHDLDFSVINDKMISEMRSMLEFELSPDFFYMSDEDQTAYLEQEENRAFHRALKDIENLSLIKEIRKYFPEFKITNSFAGLKPGERVITGKIGEHVIDLFFVTDNKLDTREKGFQDWEPIFIAKIKMGRAKDMRDFANYVPYAPNEEFFISQVKGFRHFNFIRNNLKLTKPQSAIDLKAQDFYAEYRKTTDVAPGTAEDLSGFRSYLGMDVETRDEDVSKKLLKDLEERIQDNLIDENSEYSVPQDFFDITNRQRALEIAYKWADKLSLATGIANERVTAEQASEMLAKTSTPYNNEPAFFFNGKVYLVDDVINLNNVLHEFAHPVVQMIAINNPELFTKLYTDLQMTKEGQDIIDAVKLKYPKLEEGSTRFMEEVIVTALGNSAEIKANQSSVNNQSQPESTGFAKVIKNILYAIKQLLRKAFGKVKVENLNENTTLDELAEMLTSKDFVIEQDKVTTEEFAMFAKINKDQINEMAKKVNTDKRRESLQFMINQFFDKTRKSQTLVGRQEFRGIREELVSDTGGGLLKRLADQLSGYETRTNMDEKRNTLNKMRDVQSDLQALVNSVATLKVVVERLDKSLSDIRDADTPDFKSDLNTTSYYKLLLNSWSEFIEDSLKDLKEAGLKPSDPLVQELTQVKESINQAQDSIYDIQKRASGDMIYDTLMIMRENMKQEHLREMERLNKKVKESTSDSDKQYGLKLMQEEKARYEKFEITPELIQKVLAGETEDIGWWEKELLGIMNIDDPVIGAVGVFMKDVYLRAQNQAEKLNMEFAKDIKDDLINTGYNPNRVADFWDQFLFEDTTFEYDKDGVLTPKKVITFLNPLKDYRFAKRKMFSNFQLLKDTGTKEEIAAEAKRIRSHINKYWHQKYTSAFYETDKIFDEPLGDIAWMEREIVLDQIRMESGKNMTEFEEYMDHDANSILWRKYNALYSLSHEDGTPKQDDDLKKAQLLRRHRESTRKFYEWVPIKGAFQTAIENFVGQLQVAGMTPEEINDMVYGEKGWVRKNTKLTYTAEWYEKRLELIDNIRDFSTKLKERFKNPTYKKKLQDAGIDIKDIEALDVSEQYTYIIDLVTGFRSEDGQPLASDMGEQRLSRMFDLQNQIVNAQEKLSIFTGLSVYELEDYSQLQSILDDGIALSPEQEDRFNTYTAKQGALPVSPLELAALKGLYAELNKLQFREATDNYLDVMNVFMKVVGGPALDKTNADDMLDPLKVQPLLKKNEKFKEWFDKNHIVKEYYSSKEGKIMRKYERLYAWSVVRPSNNKYIKTFKIIDPVTNKERSVLGEPSGKYSFRRVKNEFRTIPVGLTPEQRQSYVGVIIDNMGNYLPKSRISEVKNPLTSKMDKVDVAPDDTYVNEAYYALDNTDSAKFKLLNKVRNWHVKFQDGLSRDSKLYMDLPRFRKENLEAAVAGQLGKKRIERFKKVTGGVYNWATRKGKDAANEAAREADDFQEGVGNAQIQDMTEVPMVRFMHFGMDDEEGSERIPIHGLADIPTDETSKDVLHSMGRYMMSGQQQKVLSEVNPLIKGLKDVVNDPRSMPKDLTKASITHKEERNIMRYRDRKDKRNRRRDLLNYMYNREFKGQIYGDEEHLVWFNKFTSALMKGASFSFFALNISSAVKNYWSMLWQQTMEGMGGLAYDKQVEDFLAPQSYNAYSYGEGKLWAKTAMWEWSNSIFGIENIADMSLTMQMIRRFDAVQGKTFDPKTYGREASRTLLSDIASLTFFYSPRKFLEVEGALQVFGSMMKHQQVEITENGQTRFISYMDAFEKGQDGMMKLRDGIDKEWDINGKKFNAFVSRLHEVSNQLAGAFDKFNQPAAQRNFAYRLWSFMRRWMTTMFMARWSNERYNFGMSNTYEGFHITFLKTLSKIFKTLGKHMMFMSPKERAAVFKVTSDVALFFICWAIKNLLFGFDDDDEDRFKKLKAWRKDEPLESWLGVHLLKQTMMVASENSAFIPLPGMGLDDYVNVTNFSSVAMGPTVKAYGNILYDLINLTNKKGYYQRDIGVYPWQKKQSAKVFNHAAAIAGFTGKDIEPLDGVKSFNSVDNKFK